MNLHQVQRRVLSATRKKIYFTPETGILDATVVRDGIATYFDQNGILQTAPANTARFEFDSVTGEFLGVLVELEDINLLTRNDDFSNAYWTKTRVDVGGVRVSPTGENNARKLLQDTGFTLAGTLGRLDSVSGTHVWSIFVKKEEKNWCYIRTNTATGNNRLTWFNIDSGTIGQKNPAHSASILPIGNQYYRITVIDDSPTSNRQLIYLADADGSEFVSGNGGGIVIFGFQLSRNPSSYIPTSGSQVTRPADIITVPIPLSATQVTYTINGTITTQAVTGGGTFQLPVGHIKNLYFS